jgi:ferritin-like metal-binding protein YciE
MAKASKKLDDLFHDTLKDIYFAEKKILTALPKMAKAAQNDDLRAAFQKHHAETEQQVKRLDQVFGLIDAKPQGKTCPAIIGMIEEGQEVIEELQGDSSSGCWIARGCPVSRALRDLSLRHVENLGRRTRAGSGRPAV